ncbi:DEKNAAC102914 [Brettanomyces naardenensis]|uniref:DEKNAAC102914 n=1 Tax=Brettanomyces naardenensis TaxID=13370 RepID=A0A448YLX7_BRENA|nr:DEKNAAC102914 [Brettanomyces naardenensis]
MFTTSIALLLLVILLISWPYLKTNLSDISPAFLQRQSSVGPTRKSNESAAYRSVDVPHGLPLTGGLRIRIGYKLRDGCLKDIWDIALKGGNKEASVVFPDDLELTIGQINTVINSIADKLAEITEDTDKIGIFSDFLSTESILLALSCFFISERTLVNYNSIPSSPAKDVRLMVVDKRHADKVKGMGFKRVIVIEGGSTGEKGSTGDGELPSIFPSLKEPSPTFSSSYSPNEQYMQFNNQPYSEINDFRQVDFFQRNFVSTVASRLLSLPAGFEWSESDSVLISVSPFDVSSKNALITNLLCGLVSKVSKITIVNEEKLNLDSISSSSATILSTSDQCLHRLTEDAGGFLTERSESLNSLGIFNRIGRISRRLDLKIVYALQTNKPLTSREYNRIRSCLGSRIVRETYNHLAIGPVLKTNIFEYRVLGNEVLRKSRVVQLGVAVNCLELKIKKEGEKDDKGELYARGYSVGKGKEGVDYDEEFWVNLGVEGRFGRDGCFYELRPRN